MQEMKTNYNIMNMLTVMVLFLLTLFMLSGNGQLDSHALSLNSNNYLLHNYENKHDSTQLQDTFFAVNHNSALESESFIYWGMTTPQCFLSGLCYLMIFTFLLVFFNNTYERYLKKSNFMSWLNLERILSLLQKVDGKKEYPPKSLVKDPGRLISWV